MQIVTAAAAAAAQPLLPLSLPFRFFLNFIFHLISFQYLKAPL
jgi:hypothetical protein